jgi:tetratricopeptide (TPR) repeat protein
MKHTFSIAVFFTISFLFHSASVNAQGHMHGHEPAEKLGRVNFTISCSPAAKKQFNRAVAWLHSFEYEEAERAFTKVADTDPKCGMAYWGIAMSNYHPLWAPPTPDELNRGLSGIKKAKEVGARTQRENDYIAAIDLFYKDATTVDHRTRTFAYHEAMKKVHETYPSDTEASVFYALTLIATGTMSNDKTYAREKEAAKILNRVLMAQPQHPGVTHYLIHSYDYPALAQLALPAARNYARIAPASAHAQHMPSHIFTRLGLWQDAIRSNLGARESAKAFARRHNMPGAWDEQLHAMDYLAYAYLQGAQDKEAAGVLEELNQIRQIDPPSFKVAYALSAIPARYALERRRWNEAANLPLRPGGMEKFPWEQFPWAEAQIHFARAIGAARTGNKSEVQEETDQLATIKRSLSDVKGGYDWSKQVEIKRQVASAWLAYLEGKHDEAIRMMRAAADLDDATEKHPVTPGTLMPAREQLGELLLELKQPTAALQEFETSLRTSPNRFNGLYGAARSAKLAGDHNRARTYYEKLTYITRQSDGLRPEIEEAKAFLTSIKTSARR